MAKEKIYENDEYKITFSLASTWDKGYNATISIENVGEASIQNWRLKYKFNNDIDAIWNAEISSCSEDKYVVKNVGWNQDIAAGGKVEFGFSGNQAFNGFPESFELVHNSMIVQENDYTVEYIVDGDWESGFYGSILITNHTDSDIEEWILEFDFDREITEIWNGVIESHEGNHYTVRNAEYNSLLSPGTSVSIGIKGSEGTLDDVPCNYVLYACTESVTEEDNEGDISGGDEPDSPVSDGDISNGDISDGDVTEGDVTGGDVSQGDVTDGDIAEDVEEIQDYTRYWSDMLDTDGDGLPDEYENDIGTDIHNPDTDGDKLSDGYEELYSSTDPLDQYTLGNGVMDSELDPDEDGLTILEESILGTDPLNPDSDEDELKDGEETGVYETKPMEWDTDGDTISDGDEVKIGLNPLEAETYGYPDANYKYETGIAEDSIIFTKINSDNNDYQMSLEMTAQGSVVSELIVRESAYSEILNSEAVVGSSPEIIHRGTGKIESVTVKFKIDDDKIYDTYSAESLKGAKRYNIFMYCEDEKFPVPLNTVVDEETNTISATVDCVGTFCVVDMELWLQNLGFEIKTDDALETNSMSMEQTMMSSRVAYVRPSEAENTDKGFVLVPKQKKMDIVLCFNRGKKDYYCQNTDSIRESILSMAEFVFEKSDDVRIFALDREGNLIDCVEGSEGLTRVDELLDAALAQQSDYQYADKQMKTILNELDLREDAFKLTILWGATSAYENFDKERAEMIDRQIRCGTICTDWYHTSSYFASLANASGGFSATCTSAKNSIIDYICLKNMNYSYNIITSTGLKSVALEKELSYRYWTDSDGDGLSDLQEVRTDRITHKSDGTVALPTYYEYIQKYNAPEAWLVDWAYRYNDVEDFKGRGIQELLEETYVLPVDSDPSLVDSDGDGISDYDECVWDGVDERYRDLGPLHKDTIETLFPEFAEEGEKGVWNPVYITVEDNNVVINIRALFSAGANESAVKYLKTSGLRWTNQKVCNDILNRVGNDVTFKELYIDALNERWAGEYQGSDFDFFENMKVNFSVNVIEETNWGGLKRLVEINFKPGVCGVSNATFGNWSKSKSKVINMYTGYCNDEKHRMQGGATCSNYLKAKYDIAVFSGGCAHETGHICGLADLYASAPFNNGFEPIANNEIRYTDTNNGLPNSYGTMRNSGDAVSNDIEMILLAFVENSGQYYVPNGDKQKMSLAIKSEIEFHQPSIPNAIYKWDEHSKKMKLK